MKKFGIIVTCIIGAAILAQEDVWPKVGDTIRSGIGIIGALLPF